jgi:hypothetical protein
MASETYGPYTIVSRPAWRSDYAAWLPFSVVMWKHTEDLRWREFTSRKRFKLEKDAVLFGLAAARAWIANHPLSARDISRFARDRRLEIYHRRASDRKTRDDQVVIEEHGQS